jgi:MoaA/NifB/PqqE/SkfB family radical SAM enzyme
MCYTDCFNRPDKIRAELTIDQILRIMDELADAGCLELCLTGGEPLARPDFFDLYEHAIAKGFLVTLFSNGTLITDTVADRLAANPPHRIEISLHGLTEQSFEAITQGRSSYGRCMNAIRLLMERRVPLVLKTTAMTLNRQEILDIKQYVQRLGSVGYKLGEDIRPALDGSDVPFRFSLTPEEIEDLNHQDPQLSHETCQQQSVPAPACRSGMRSFHIDAYGFLQLCSGNRTQGYDLHHGSFKDGFYKYLPNFGCRWKGEAAPMLLQPSVMHG